MTGAVCWTPNRSTYAEGYKAGADLSAATGKGLKFDSSGDLVVAGAGEVAVGFLQDPCSLGRHPDVIAHGGCFAMAGAAVARGDYLKLDSSGRVIPVTNIGDNIVGYASFEAGAAGDIFGIMAMKGSYGGSEPTGEIATPAGTGVTAVARAATQQIVLTFDNVAVTMADNAGVVAYGSLKILDFAAGVTKIFGAVANLALTKSSAGVIATWDGDFALGTAAANSGATLVGTEADIIPSTATPQAVSGATTATGSSFGAVTALTDNSAGTANSTVQAMADPTDTPATADALRDDLVAVLLPAIRNNIADLAAKINELIAAQGGAIAPSFDGTTTPKDVYFNILVDDADHDVTTTPCNLILNGTITLTVALLGDY